MKFLYYSMILLSFGTIYLNHTDCKNSTVVCGYSELTNKYTFWRFYSLTKFELIGVYDSKLKAEFYYRIFAKE